MNTIISQVVEISKYGYDMMYNYHVDTLYWVLPFDGYLINHIVGLDVLECIDEVGLK